MLFLVKLLNAITIGEGDSAVRHEKGATLNVDEATAKEWIANGTAEDHTEAAAKAAFTEAVAKEAKAEVQKQLAALNKANKSSGISGVHDTSEDDPTLGYLPGKDAYSADEATYVGGLMFSDVLKTKDGGHAPERLQKSQKMAEKQIADMKGAGHAITMPDDALGGYAIPTLVKSVILGQKAAGSGSIVGADAYGGFTVATLISNMLLARDTLEATVVRPRAQRIPLVGSNRLEMPVFNDSTHADKKFFGGVAAYWDKELEELASSRPAFEKVSLQLHALTALGYVSQEMEMWGAASIGSVLIPKFSQAIAWKEDDAFITGTGAGQPLGLLNVGAKVEIAKESNQVAATIVYTNILKMVARLRVSRPSSVAWIANRTTLPALATMSLTIGTGGAPVFLPSNLAAGQPLASLFGYPIIFTEKAKALGTVGDIMLCDLSEYAIGDNSTGPVADRSIHLKFDFRQTAFRIVTFVDGQPLWRTVFTPANGDSLAPTVTLATRE